MIGSLAKTVLLLVAVLASLQPSSFTDSAAWAGRSLSDLAKVSAGPEPGARLPLAIRFTNEKGDTETLAQALDGRPAVLLFVDYACKNICSAMLALTARALVASTLRPGVDYRLLAIGLDPKLDIAIARDLKDAILDPSIEPATQFLSGDAASIARVAASVGYRFFTDEENRQFAHAAAVLIVSREGRISAAISAATVSGETLRRGLVAAQQEPFALDFAPIRLLCYGLTPSHGRYTNVVILALRAGVVTLLVAGVFLLRRRAA